jgi:hypothetical protein
VSAYPEGMNAKDKDGKLPFFYLKDAVSESNDT